MKKLSSLLILMFSVMLAHGQEWSTDFTEAKAAAAENHYPIIMVFQGSDWCAPCMKLDREVWSTEEFQTYAQDHYVMLKVDFPRRKENALSPEQQEKNNKLAETYNQHGYFPLVVIVDAEGHVLGQTGYKKMTAKEYIEHLNSFNN